MHSKQVRLGGVLHVVTREVSHCVHLNFIEIPALETSHHFQLPALKLWVF